MRLREYLLSLGIALYFLCTANALLFTLFRFSFLPKPFTRYFYGMMAPYQAYDRRNLALVAEGKRKDGTWETVDLVPYFPGSRGERLFREFLLSRRAISNKATQKGYEHMSKQLQTHEAMHGRAYTEIRLSMEAWPISPGGYEAMRLPVFCERELLFPLL